MNICRKIWPIWQVRWINLKLKWRKRNDWFWSWSFRRWPLWFCGFRAFLSSCRFRSTEFAISTTIGLKPAFQATWKTSCFPRKWGFSFFDFSCFCFLWIRYSMPWLRWRAWRSTDVHWDSRLKIFVVGPIRKTMLLSCIPGAKRSPSIQPADSIFNTKNFDCLCFVTKIACVSFQRYISLLCVFLRPGCLCDTVPGTAFICLLCWCMGLMVLWWMVMMMMLMLMHGLEGLHFTKYTVWNSHGLATISSLDSTLTMILSLCSVNKL